MPTPRASRTFRVRVNDASFQEDFWHATAAGKRVLTAARRQLERHGIAREQLRVCRAGSRGGTDLGDCFKAYLPAPAGRWGVVLQLAHDGQGFYLLAIAFGAPSESQADRVRRRAPASARRMAARHVASDRAR